MMHETHACDNLRMRRKLRSNFEPGSPRWATRRSQWRALGLTDADMEKPKIAVINSSSELASCFSHLDGVAAIVKDAVRAAGGLPFEVRTAAPSDFITSAGHRGGYILPTRDLIVNDIEVQVEGALLDGMVCLASCDKTTPGQLMAAGRLNIPSIVVICGYQASGEYRGRHIDIEEVFLKASQGAAVNELVGMSDHAVLGPGVCAGMGTANSMHTACEALGMTLPGAAPVLANSERMKSCARACGERIVQMVWEDLKPRDILTRAAFINATLMVLALSGSINCVKHLQAIALEAGCDVDVYALFEQYAAKIPLLAAIRPNGERRIEELEAAGGARAVMKRLETMLETQALTASGKTVKELLNFTLEESDVIRALHHPISTRPTIVIVRGSLAPEGGIVRLGGAGERTLRFSGPARIYHAREEALEALSQGRIARGDVVVLRGMGVKGGPGMAMASALVFALDGAGLLEEVAVVTDGQLSGLVNRGLVVGEISPEAADGGALGLLEDGDRISIDIEKRAVDHDLDAATPAARRSRLRPLGRQDEVGYLSQYQRIVQPLPQGAVLGKP
jgi:dihydroxy-acid dehydratase